MPPGQRPAAQQAERPRGGSESAMLPTAAGRFHHSPFRKRSARVIPCRKPNIIPCGGDKKRPACQSATTGHSYGGIIPNLEMAIMSKNFMQLVTRAFILVGLLALTQAVQAQNPTPSMYNRPDYNYSESSSCINCHFVRGAAGADHN